MKRTIVLLLMGCCAAAPAVCEQLQRPSFELDKETLVKSEARRYALLRGALRKPASDPNIDVTYYKLDLTITTTPNYLRGVVTMNALSVVASLTAVTLDLMKSMTVDSVKSGGTQLAFVQQSATMTVTLDRSYINGELATMDIYYRGVPGSSGFGSFTFSSYDSMPWIFTLSEPYGARDWWPCKDHPADKADSVDLWVTVDSTLKVGSNGRLVEVIDNTNGTKTHRWKEQYPISTYLVSLAVGDYAEFTNWFKYSPTDSMPVLNYVLPEHLTEAQRDLPKTVDMLKIYSNVFGLYPFINEKYGHSECDLGGGMENQTMTSLGGFWFFGIFIGFSDELVAHELAHMWFGDMITCADWPNIWMNEGFATYCTALYYECMYGTSRYTEYMSSLMGRAKSAVGSLYVRDTLNTLFDFNRVYAKGASVLHMLRHVMGDTLFFRSLRAYAQDSRFRFAVATTEDFRQVCENVSGSQLGYFFDEWVYGESYPRYTCTWKREQGVSGYEVTFRLSQTSGATTGPTFFSMPMDCRLACTGWDTTVALFHFSDGQQFTVTTSHMPDTLQLDPDNWILREIQVVLSTPNDASELPKTFALHQNYPNPFNPITTITYELPKSSQVNLSVYDMLGREVSVLVNERRNAGVHEVKFDGSGLASGLYLYRFQAGDFVATKRLLFLK